MTRTRVALARVWNCSPTHLRDLTRTELAAMLDLLDTH
jgi:hypothetical protein